MNRLIYFLLACLLDVGCARQAKTTHSKNDIAPIDSTLTAINGSHENTALTDSISNSSTLIDSALTDSTLTDSILANLQCYEVYNDRELIPSTFRKDTIETVLSTGSVKTFLSEDKKEIVWNDINGDTIWYTGTKANAVISNYNQVDRTDTIIITRSLLAKQFNISDIEEYEITSIYYDSEKGDTTCFTIGLYKFDTDNGFEFKYYHTNESYYIEEVYVEWKTDED